MNDMVGNWKERYPCKAMWIFDSISQVTAEMTCFSSTMELGEDGHSEKSIRLDVLGTRTVRNRKIKPTEKKRLPSLPRVQSLADLMYSKFFGSVQTLKGTPEPSNQWRHSSKASLTANGLGYQYRSCVLQMTDNGSKTRKGAFCHPRGNAGKGPLQHPPLICRPPPQIDVKYQVSQE